MTKIQELSNCFTYPHTKSSGQLSGLSITTRSSQFHPLSIRTSSLIEFYK
jgi:hypothetical protein